MNLKGIYQSKEHKDIQIIVEREYKKKDTVDFFYYMCKYSGGGTISKNELIEKYEIVKR